MQRSYNIQRATTEYFDLVVIGGGITGAGIALSAARKGWKTLILDKQDFAWGTSSRSAKMIHGGLRYLQYLQIKLVKEALQEREHLLKEYPHLVKPQPFFMPIYKSRLSKLKYGIGLSGYDYLSGESSLPKHNAIDLEEIKDKFPQLKTDEMIGGFIYYDARTNDARMTNEVIQQATELGAIAINYCELTGFNKQDNKLNSITCRDTISGKDIRIESKVFISATGVWTDETQRLYDPQDSKRYMAPSKGVHIVVNADHLPKDCVLILPTSNHDGRFIWCLPWEDNLNVIGTTDTDYPGSLDEVLTEKEEIDYVLNSVNAQLKGEPLTYDHILSVYAGLRPLLNDNDEQKKSNARSRDYSVWWNNDNFLTVSGGKFTSFLSMAEHCLETIEAKHRIRSNKNDSVHIESLIDRFKERYGIRNATAIANIAQEDPEYLQPLNGYPYTIAEILFAIRHQHAVRLDDVLTRRTLISYSMPQWDEALVQQVTDILARELQWSEADIQQETEHYRAAWETLHTWK